MSLPTIHLSVTAIARALQRTGLPFDRAQCAAEAIVRRRAASAAQPVTFSSQETEEHARQLAAKRGCSIEEARASIARVTGPDLDARTLDPRVVARALVAKYRATGHPFDLAQQMADAQIRRANRAVAAAEPTPPTEGGPPVVRLSLHQLARQFMAAGHSFEVAQQMADHHVRTQRDGSAR